MTRGGRKWLRTSRAIAKERLETMLFADRLNCSPEMVDQMKHDMAAVMEKYQLDIAAHIRQGGKHVKTIQIKGL